VYHKIGSSSGRITDGLKLLGTVTSARRSRGQSRGEQHSGLGVPPYTVAAATVVANVCRGGSVVVVSLRTIAWPMSVAARWSVGPEARPSFVVCVPTARYSRLSSTKSSCRAQKLLLWIERRHIRSSTLRNSCRRGHRCEATHGVGDRAMSKRYTACESSRPRR
jgi:hypothetical protein